MYRQYDFPSKELQYRLERSLGDLLVKFYDTEISSPDGGEALADAYEIFTVNLQKADWSNQNNADPEGPDAPWGERTITNGYPSRYSMKSFEAYVTPTGFGVVGFDEYGDRGMHFERHNHPDETGLYRDWKTTRPPVPEGTLGAKSVEEMIAMANSMALEIIEEYELPEDRLTPATEVASTSPIRMTPLQTPVSVSTCTTPKL
jgi:hypothetical protein